MTLGFVFGVILCFKETSTAFGYFWSTVQRFKSLANASCAVITCVFTFNISCLETSEL